MFPAAMVAVVSFTTIAAVMFWIIVTALSYIVTAVIVSCITASMLDIASSMTTVLADFIIHSVLTV